MMEMAHYTYGFNPGVSRFTGRIVEDERVFGVFDFGFGSRVDRPSASHFDVVITKPTIRSGGVDIQRDGKYVHPDLVEDCRRMGVPGY
jgi:leucyl aminopeptidase (aminopeptidase T)